MTLTQDFPATIQVRVNNNLQKTITLSDLLIALSADDFTAQGPFVKFRFKFERNSLRDALKQF
jgi:hypothetical protein